MNREYHFRVKGNEDQIREILSLPDGETQTVVADGEAINITWKSNSDNDPLQKVADILQEGNYAEGISLLELFLSDDPANTPVFFNLGRAYSDQGQWDRSIELRRKLIERATAHEWTRRAGCRFASCV